MKLIELGKSAKIISGFAFKSESFTDNGIPVIKISNIGLGDMRIEESNTQYVESDYLDKLDEKFKVSFGDVLISLTGSHITQPNSVVGRVSLYKESYISLLNQRAGKVINIDKKVFDKRFLFYILNSASVRTTIALMAHGAASQANVSPKDVERIKLLVPTVENQKKIAAILSAYDDLIENNKKRIQILENMAEELYKEWFVRFRFPDWENTEFEKGVPKGWEIEKVSNLVDRKKFGRVYKEFELASEGSVPVIDQSQKNILGFHEGEAEHKASFESPMIIFGDHSCKMQMMFENFSLAENVIPLKSKGNISLLYLFSLIKDQVETTEYKRHWGELTSKKVLLAPISLQEKYASLIIDKMKLIETLKTANNYLVSCRDQLLPRLISGKLSVEELDIQFPPSMQEQ